MYADYSSSVRYKLTYTEDIVNSITSIIVIATSFVFSGCSVIEMGGKMTRMTGEVMTDYSKNHTGFLATGAGFGGKVNTAVGGAVENVAKKGESDANGSKGEQFVVASKEVATAAVNSVSTKADETTVNVRAQKRLQELGYSLGTPDGMIGPKTKAALGDYQKKNSLQVTQTLDAPTLAALDIHP